MGNERGEENKRFSFNLLTPRHLLRFFQITGLVEDYPGLETLVSCYSDIKLNLFRKGDVLSIQAKNKAEAEKRLRTLKMGYWLVSGRTFYYEYASNSR